MIEKIQQCGFVSMLKNITTRFNLALLACLALLTCLGTSSVMSSPQEDGGCKLEPQNVTKRADDSQMQRSSQERAQSLRVDQSPFQIGLAGAPLALFGEEDAPTFDPAFQHLADQGFDFFFPLFVKNETPERSSYSTHGSFFFPARLTGKPMEQSCGGPFNPYRAALGKIAIVYPGIQLIGLFDTTQPINEEEFLTALAVHENECPDFRKVVSAFYSFDEPSLNRVVAQYTGKPQVASGNEATVARLVRQAWGVPVIIVDAPDESAIQPTGLPPDEMIRAVNMFWSDVRKVAASQDVYGFNVYSIPEFRLTLAGDYCQQAREAAPSQRIISVIQGMSFAGITGDPAGGRAPTEDEVRFQAIDSLIAGADMLCWYGCSSLDLDLPGDQQLWSSICKVARQIKSINAGFREKKAAADFHAELGYRCHASENEMTVLLTNRSERLQTLTLDFAAGWKRVEVIAGPTPKRGVEGQWELECPALTACIFRFRR